MENNDDYGDIMHKMKSNAKYLNTKINEIDRESIRLGRGVSER